MTLDLRGRAAVITGAASGIGRGLALKAAQEGMGLALADVDSDGLVNIAQQVKELGADVITSVVDVRQRDQLQQFAERCFAHYESVALVFANAGVNRAATSWLQPAADWDLMVDINLKGAMHTAAAFIPKLLAQNSAAQLVFTGSTSAFSPRPQIAAYSCTKHALWGLAEAMYLELKMQDAPVSVSFLAPSGVRTAIFDTPSHAPGGEVQDMLRGAIEAMGMPTEQLAEIVFAALKGRKFWILPHPDFKDSLQRRVARIVAEQPPEFG